MKEFGRKVVVAGVSGCGKSVVGRELAKLLAAEFIDADDFHSPAAVAKMASGTPLDDTDRAGWLSLLGQAMVDCEGSVVLACSALRKAYRNRLRELCDGLVFVLLTADPDVIRNRMKARCEAGEHFMPPALLDTQLATLELGDDVMVVPNLGSPGDVATVVLAKLS